MAATGQRFHLGLISGTSADAIDAALMAFDPLPRVHASLAFAYPPLLRERVLRLAADSAVVNLDELGALDVAIGHAFADAAIALLREAQIGHDAVSAIGSHGQTVRHRPFGGHPFTLQIGDPSVIAERTGITTVADFRRRDIAAGGQGAPLVPAFHAALFGNGPHARVVLNLGGISNITYLPARAQQDDAVIGFDVGPANCLLDAWAMRHLGTARDDGGAWARLGTVDDNLLRAMRAEPYFTLPPPKSTGRELFNSDWLARQLASHTTSAPDVQATLLQLTATTIADAIRRYTPATAEIVVCGGGVHNDALIEALVAAAAPCRVVSSAAFGIDPDFVEASAFAWLAHRRLQGLPGNLAGVTGAAGPRVLGGVYFGN